MTDGLEEMGLPPLGHNKPPQEGQLDADALFAELDKLIANANRWRAERPSITDPEMAGQAQKFVDQLRGLRDDLRACYAQEKQPFENALTLLGIKFKTPIEKAIIALDGMLALTADWLKRERARIEAERVERERQAAAAQAEAEQLDQLANAPGASVETQLAADEAMKRAVDLADAAAQAERPQIKGDYAVKAMSLRSNWKARVANEGLALRHYRDNREVRDAQLAAIVKVATKHAKAAKDASKAPPGIVFYNDERAQ